VPLAVLRNPQRRDPGGSDAPSCRPGAAHDANLRRRCLRPMWDIGRLSPTGERAVSIASLWVENMPILEPGSRATVRLVPLTPSHWTHVQPGWQITMHEDRTVAGTAVILEVHRPATAKPAG
jgi:hypothetical protein